MPLPHRTGVCAAQAAVLRWRLTGYTRLFLVLAGMDFQGVYLFLRSTHFKFLLSFFREKFPFSYLILTELLLTYVEEIFVLNPKIRGKRIQEK